MHAVLSEQCKHHVRTAIAVKHGNVAGFECRQRYEQQWWSKNSALRQGVGFDCNDLEKKRKLRHNQPAQRKVILLVSVNVHKFNTHCLNACARKTKTASRTFSPGKRGDVEEKL